MRKSPTELSDDELLERLMMWVRISRNEGDLHGEDRKYFQAIVAEIKKRELMSLKKKTRREIYYD